MGYREKNKRDTHRVRGNAHPEGIVIEGEEFPLLPPKLRRMPCL